MEIDYSIKYRRLFLPNIKASKLFAVSFGKIIESDNERVFNLVEMYDAVCYEPDRDKAMEKASALCREIVELKLKRPCPLNVNEKKALNVLYYSLITCEWKEIQHGNKRRRRDRLEPRINLRWHSLRTVGGSKR